MVAGFQDDVDLEDKPPGRPLLPTGPVPRGTTLSSEEGAGHPKATVLAPQKCAEPETKRYVEGSHCCGKSCSRMEARLLGAAVGAAEGAGDARRGSSSWACCLLQGRG